MKQTLDEICIEYYNKPYMELENNSSRVVVLEVYSNQFFNEEKLIENKEKTDKIPTPQEFLKSDKASCLDNAFSSKDWGSIYIWMEEYEKFCRDYHLTKQSEWKNVNEKLPFCFEDGDWDGKRSSYCFVKLNNGLYDVAILYSGILDGSEFAEWYDNNENDFGSVKVTHWKEII